MQATINASRNFGEPTRYISLCVAFLILVSVGCAGQNAAVSQAPISLSLAPVGEQEIVPQQSDRIRGISAPGERIVSAARDEAEDDVADNELEDDVADNEFDNEFEDEFEDELDFFEDEAEEEEPARVADPLFPWNRLMFHFNDKLYFWVLKPVAQGYKAVTPPEIRVGVKNFFENITTPIRAVNCVLQGKFDAAKTEMGRFLLNTTVGVLGVGDVASLYPRFAKPKDEDMGQTLGSYGIGNGFYVVWPILGPSTIRDSLGMIGDTLLNPFTYIEMPSEALIGANALEKVNETSFRIGDYESLKEAAVDPYEAFRDAYIQYRQQKVEDDD